MTEAKTKERIKIVRADLEYREYIVIKFLCYGMRINEIASRIGRGRGTISDDLIELRARYDCGTTTELCCQAVDDGLITMA